MHTTLHQGLTKGHALRLHHLEVPHQANPLTHTQRQHRNETQQRAQRKVAVTQDHRDKTTQQGHRHAGDGQQRQAPTAQRRLHHQEDQHRRCRQVAVERADGLALRKVLTHHQGVVLKRERDLLDAARHLARDTGHVTIGDIGPHIHPPRHALAPDHVLRRHGADIGHVRQPHLAALGCIEQHVADVADIGAHLGLAQHHHVKHLLVLEQRTHLDARHQGGRSAPHITRLQAMGEGLFQINLHFDGGLLLQRFDTRVRDALDLGQQRTHLFGLAAHDLLVVAVDAHADAVVTASQHLTHLLGQEGVDLALDAGIVLQHHLHRLYRVVVVGLGIDADPDLCGIDIRHLFREHRPTHMRRRIGHAFDTTQRLHQRSGGAVHRFERRARRAPPLHHHIGFFEDGQPGMLGRGPHQHTHHHPARRQHQGRQRRAQHAVQGLAASALKAGQQGRSVTRRQWHLSQQETGNGRRQGQRHSQ